MTSSDSTVSQTWFVYLLRCADGTLYAGVSTDVARRVGEHTAGAPLGARYTRARRPVVLVYVETAASRSEALRRERAIKAMTRVGKLALIATRPLKANTG
jgi:putative endonuclease